MSSFSFHKGWKAFAFIIVVYFWLKFPTRFLVEQNIQLRVALPIVVYLILFGWGNYLLRKKWRVWFHQIRQSPKRFFLQLALGVVLLILLEIIGSLLTAGLGNALAIDPSALSNDNNVANVMTFFPRWLTILVLGVFGPMVEEIVYRYLLINALKPYLPLPVVLILSSLTFALLHVHHWELAELALVIPHFCFGLAQAIIYFKTDNLSIPVFLHVFNNVSIFLFN